MGTQGAGSFTRDGKTAHKIRMKLNFHPSQNNINSSKKKKKHCEGGSVPFRFMSHGCPLDACKLSDVSDGEVTRSLVALLPKGGKANAN